MMWFNKLVASILPYYAQKFCLDVFKQVYCRKNN